MKASHDIDTASSPRTAFDDLQAFIADRRQARGPLRDMEDFERQVHERFAAAEREFLGEELAAMDIDVPAVIINGVPHHRALRSQQTYMSASGPVKVPRTLFRAGRDGTPCVCPVEVRAGIVEGFWTPLAAKQAAWVVAHMPPGESERLFDMLGGMNPSRSTLDRLPKRLDDRWQQDRDRFEEVLRDLEEVPAAAVMMAVSLDGVLVPMKDAKRQEKRAQAAAEGKQTKGPAGYKEAG